MKRKALGRGLNSLIPQKPVPKPSPEVPAATASGLRQIDLDLIQPNQKQPRQKFDADSLASLAASLSSEGVLQPVVVREIGGGRFELIAGERRWRAAQLAGLLKIPAIVRAVPDSKLLEYALIENLQREDLDPIEQAESYRSLADEYGLTHKEIAERVGKQRATVANTIRLLSLVQSVQEQVRSGAISTGHAKALVALERPGQQAELAAKVIQQGLSVRQLEQLVARARAAEPKPRRPGPSRDPNLVAAEEALQRELGTRVRIFQGKKEGGRIELHCASEEELTGVYELLISAARRRGEQT